MSLEVVASIVYLLGKLYTYFFPCAFMYCRQQTLADRTLGTSDGQRERFNANILV
jgi:hypothetical protein